jgi:8-oxo-dGTP diphosphatase
METFIGRSVIIYNDDGRMLIAQRSKIKKLFPLKWETIGGALEPDETPEECIRRETREEIGCELYNLELFNVYVVREAEEQHVLIAYTGKIKESVQPNCEIASVQWITENDIESYEFYAPACKKKLCDFYRIFR